MHLYTCSSFTGTMHDCDEGTLEWINKKDILSLELWEGDRAFLPVLMKKKGFIRMRLTYDNGKLIRSDIL